MKDYRQTLLSQYATSPTISAIADRFNDWIDPGADIDAFFNIIWNVETAEGVGLDFWGKVVDVTRKFYDRDSGTTYTLEDPAYRTLIMVKAMANVTDCTAGSLNHMLRYLFAGEGRAYTLDLGSMTMRHVFEFTLAPVELAIMLTSGVVPRPAGVQAQILQVPVASTFGFNGSGLQPFNQGTFFSNAGVRYAT